MASELPSGTKLPSQEQEIPTPPTFEPAEAAAPVNDKEPQTTKQEEAAVEEHKEEPQAGLNSEKSVAEGKKAASQHQAMTSEPPPEEAPDPDEDDLSDLDDVLDEFATTNISRPAPTSSGPGRPAEPESSKKVDPFAAAAGLEEDDAFAKSLQVGMAELLSGLEDNPEMAKQFEQLVKELGAGMDMETAEATESSSSKETPEAAAKAAEATAKADASFKENIEKTMERMNASSAAATDAAAQASNAEEDFLAAMLREMEKSGPESLGAGSDEDFSKMLMGMMEQLTNKDILYEPMKELHDKFPAWLTVNRESTSKEDLERYEVQQKLVNEIVAKFEDAGYSDDKLEYREYIVERMQQMQAAGSPPPDLVGDMNAAQEAMGGMDEGCPQQ